jgi:flagellar protein FliO/FliZ
MTEFPTTLMYLFLSLALVLILAFLVLRFLSGIYSQRVLKGDIAVRSTYSLGSRQQLTVVTFRDKEYLLGVTQHNIQLLDSFKADSESSTRDELK